MKKVLQLTLFFLVTIGFSQSSRETIQNYINTNLSSLKISSNEVDKWVIGSETTSQSMNINNCLVYQTYNEIKIDNPQIYFWIKNNKVINKPDGFITNLASKVNASAPTLNVKQAFLSSLQKLNEQSFDTSIIEQSGNSYKLTNGTVTNDPIRAELVYTLNEENKLILTWNFEYYSQLGDHLWKTKINALNGDLIEKQDLVLRCNFGSKHNHESCKESLALKETPIIKNNQNSLFLTPGTTNYRVIPWNYESPNHSPRQLITNPEATTVLSPATLAASPNGWHNASPSIGTNFGVYNFTRGNNVFAKEDFDGNNDVGTSPTASSGTYPNLTFDFPYPGNGVAANTYINAATTNLFYMNNIMHDLWYQYGFDEANRNFQSANYSRGGLGGDFVNAEAQDDSILSATNTEVSSDNANFSTPSDGTSPRMQMFLWNSGPPQDPSTLLVNTGSLTGTTYDVNDNIFDPGHISLPITPLALTNNIVLFDDGTPDNSDACTGAVNGAALSGKIAVIRRGTCTFIEKVLQAQAAGAIAAIIVNNQAGIINMIGADGSITIPAVSMTQVDGEALIASLNSGGAGSVSVSLSSPPEGEVYVNTDGDFDNGIIAHEYGHGISTRLVGGGGGLNGSAEQPGEGWSDWFWLMMQIKPGDTRNDARGIGTFAVNEPTNGLGIREYRYSTDMAVNPHTFADTNDQWFVNSSGNEQVSVHGVGSIWCVMLWDLAWNYIDKYGYDSNIYNGTGGNNKLMRLVMDGMKLTPANPSLIECRDAIIQADQNTTGGENYCLIWQTFARRGMGVNATSGTKLGVTTNGVTDLVPSIKDQVEDFTEPAPGPNCTALSTSYFNNSDLIKLYPNPSKDVITLQINNYSGKLNVKLFDINGREVLTLNNTDFVNQTIINISTLSKAIYLLRIEGEDLSYTNKIVKN